MSRLTRGLRALAARTPSSRSSMFRSQLWTNAAEAAKTKTVHRYPMPLIAKALGVAVAGTAGVLAVKMTAERLTDDVEGKREFSKYTQKQLKKYPLRGTHDLFLTEDPVELARAHQYFPETVRLMPTSVEDFKKNEAKETPIRDHDIAACPVQFDQKTEKTVVLLAGGPPVAISGAGLIATLKDAVASGVIEAKEAKKIQLVYVVDESQTPTHDGSALHIEEDNNGEGPTSTKPTDFLYAAGKRAVLGYESFAKVDQPTYHPVPWRSMDWFGWIHAALTNPKLVLSGMKVGYYFQLATMAGLEQRKAIRDEVVRQTQQDEVIYQKLNAHMGGKLLLPNDGSNDSEKGGVIYAFNKGEVQDLHDQKADLASEQRNLVLLTPQQTEAIYGYNPPDSLMSGVKVHDRGLSPEWRQHLKTFYLENGHSVINGRVTDRYIDQAGAARVARIETADGKVLFMQFSITGASLGPQQTYDINGKPLFDIIGGVGVSMNAHVYTPANYLVPRTMVFGGTNHVMRLSPKPVPIEIDGKLYHLHDIRATCAAMVTPLKRGPYAHTYSGIDAYGLYRSVQRGFPGSIVAVKSVVPCKRLVSRYGQINLVNPYPGVYSIFGCGGGGLTRAPDFLETLLKNLFGGETLKKVMAVAYTPNAAESSSLKTPKLSAIPGFLVTQAGDAQAKRAQVQTSDDTAVVTVGMKSSSH